MKTLITGAGLLGCHVAQKLVETGEDAILFDVAPRMDYVASIVPLDRVKVIIGDIVDMSELVRVIEKENVEQVVHTAFIMTAPAHERPHTGVRVNIGGTTNVLEAALSLGMKRVVFTSSVSIYSRTSVAEVKEPYAEDIAFKAASERPSSIYAATKLACEHLGLLYNDLYGLDFIVLRIAGFFGPLPKGSGGPNTVAVRKIIDDSLTGKAMILERPPDWPSPREFLYVKDAANATAKVLRTRRLKNRIYNIGAGRFYDFPEVVGIAKKVIPGAAIKAKESKRTQSLTSETSWLGGIVQRVDISLAQKELGYTPEYDMEKAVADFCNWVVKNG